MPCSTWLVVLCVLLSSVSRAGESPPTDTARWDAFLEIAKKRFQPRQPEVIIRHFFRDRRDGFFLDVGAAHFEQGNTTYFLERRLGWSGIAVDALEHWRPAYEKNRPKTKFLTYIVTDHTGAKEPFYRLETQVGSTAIK